MTVAGGSNDGSFNQDDVDAVGDSFVLSSRSALALAQAEAVGCQPILFVDNHSVGDLYSAKIEYTANVD